MSRKPYPSAERHKAHTRGKEKMVFAFFLAATQMAIAYSGNGWDGSVCKDVDSTLNEMIKTTDEMPSPRSVLKYSLKVSKSNDEISLFSFRSPSRGELMNQDADKEAQQQPPKVKFQMH